MKLFKDISKTGNKADDLANDASSPHMKSQTGKNNSEQTCSCPRD